jgi:rhomboid protease GluP
MGDGFRVTGGLLTLNLGVYLLLGHLGGNYLQIDRSLLLWLGLSREAFFGGAYWQPLTSLFVHFDLPHLGYNLVFLAIFGSKGEELYGGRVLLSLYLTCGILSDLFFLLPSNALSAGASGAIFGILGADLVALRNRYAGGMRTALFLGGVFFLLAGSTGFLSHGVGLLVGMAVGYGITRNWYPAEEAEGDGEEIELPETLPWER